MFKRMICIRGHPLFSLENIYRAYRQCRKHKRGTVNALRFEQNVEENLVSLHEELTREIYQPGRSAAFLVEKPRRREIFAADFRDRVVHHILVGHLEPRWERLFICDSYACHKGKGTHLRFGSISKKRSFPVACQVNIIVAQLGNWCEVWGGHPAYPISEKQRYFNDIRFSSANPDALISKEFL
jgi:hypothetical protein